MLPVEKVKGTFTYIAIGYLGIGPLRPLGFPYYLSPFEVECVDVTNEFQFPKLNECSYFGYF